ncbi:uncharacterized protein METZ01_LOCUS271718 [marine metagenome]|uniref:Uncharacterized protein n=1 Tax=marine metagenome TaxID=408172 RepID=A0A382K1W2_9ZZZZ
MSLLQTIIRQLNEAAPKKDYPDWMKKHPDWIAKVERGRRNLEKDAKTFAALKGKKRVQEASDSPVTVRDVQPLVDKLNKILKKAQDISNTAEVKKKRFKWQQGMSDAEALKVLQRQDHSLIIKDGPKYIKLDRVQVHDKIHGSGVFMIEKSDGRIYGIKGYGTPNKIPKHQYGTVADPATKRMAVTTAVLEKAEIMRMNIQ